MPYSFDEARKAVSDNPCNMFQIGDPDLVQQVLTADYSNDAFYIGEVIEWYRPRETIKRICWVGDPADPGRKMLQPERITMDQMNALMHLDLIRRITRSVAYHIAFQVVDNGTESAHYQFSVDPWPAFNSLEPALWLDEKMLPELVMGPLDYAPYEYQDGLQNVRYASEKVAALAVTALNSHAGRNLERLGREWFVQHRLFDGKPGEVDGYYLAFNSTADLSDDEFEIRAHVVDEEEPDWDPDIAEEHCRIMTLEEITTISRLRPRDED